MPGVTVSAGFGAGGSVVAPLVAERLGVQLLDRAISAAVASQLKVSVAEAETGSANRSFVERLLSFMSPLATDALGTAADIDTVNSLRDTDAAISFREEAERIMKAAFVDGAVVLGRAGAAAFRKSPDVLRVRLFGPVEARMKQAARLSGIDSEEISAKFQREVDGARDQYVRRLYKVSVDDPALFHLQLDSTVLPLSACADLIVEAYRAFRARSATEA
jgi:cytidylate kinase